MRGGLLVAGLLALVLLPAATPAGTDTTARRGAAPLYAATWQGSLALARIDRKTLRPLAGRRVPLAGEPLGWSFAPGRARIALGSPRGARLRLIDLRAMRALGDVGIARRGSLVATAWAGPRRVLAVVVTPGCCGAGDTIVAGIDAGSRRVVWRRTLGGSLQAGERLRPRLVLLLGPPGESIGPSRLVQIDGHGDTRSADLPAIRSGTEPDGSITRTWEPGLALDRSGGRAFVVQAQAPVAEVDLETLQVGSHPLEEARASDVVAGPTRHALWLGRGLLAVTGSNSHGSGERAAGGWDTPAGLTLVDTRRWRARTIDTRTTDAALVSGTLLASSFLFDGRRQRVTGSGLTGYSVRGRRRYHVYGKRGITGVQPIGQRALVGGDTWIDLVEARTGRRLRRYRQFAMSLLNGDAAIP